jgi:hypothetical protein
MDGLVVNRAVERPPHLLLLLPSLLHLLLPLFVLAVILSAVKDPNTLNSPQPPEPFCQQAQDLIPANTNYAFPNTLAIASPISAGDFTTVIPASLIAFIFSAAVPSPPEIIAPA